MLHSPAPSSPLLSSLLFDLCRKHSHTYLQASGSFDRILAGLLESTSTHTLSLSDTTTTSIALVASLY